MSINNSFWQGKRVLITGHTGFKGSWLAIWLIRLGAKVTGIALPPNTSPNLFELANVAQDLQNYVCDIRDAASLKKILFVIINMSFKLTSESKNLIKTFIVKQ